MIAVIAAHPDDEVLGCGGRIARLSEEREVHTLIVGCGRESRANKAAAEKAAEILGTELTFGLAHYDFEEMDNRFDKHPLLLLIQSIEGWLSHVQPDTVFTHFAGDLNKDHRMVFQAVLTATRPMLGQKVRALYSFAIPSSTEWAFGQIGDAFKPNLFYDISDTIRLKQAAFSYYETEWCEAPHPRSPLIISTTAYYYGSMAGCLCAEPFQVVREIR